MRAAHVLGGKALEKDVSDSEELSFILSSSLGGFAHFSASGSTSKFQGFYAKINSQLFKIVEHISPPQEKIAAVENAGSSATFMRSSFSESFFMPKQKSSFVYQLSRELPVETNDPKGRWSFTNRDAPDCAFGRTPNCTGNDIRTQGAGYGPSEEIFLDIREANDFRQWGRNYHCYDKDGIIIIEFTKKTDSREDSSNGEDEFFVAVAIAHDGKLMKLDNEWVNRNYSLDAKRNSGSEMYVYKAATVAAGNIVVAAASSAEDAIKEASSVLSSISSPKREAKPATQSGEVAIAADCAKNAIEKLKTTTGVYAGLPWFFQEWSRDELISCSALPTAVKKKIVLKYLDKVMDDGRLPTIIGGKATCADSIGWLFKRASELFDENALSASEIKLLQPALKKSINSILACHCKNGFITNGKNETWMDTDFNDDGRTGICIEIQALQLNMYRLMHRLTGEKTYQLLENSLLSNTRKLFWDGSILADRLNDFTARPNLFIAAYIYPELLSRKEWEACITNVLPKLWLSWGGLSTINKSHRNFQGTYTGETNQSYHRGDSWFWVNNIAAIVMHTVNKKKFRQYIKKITAASANDILWKGALGCASELSSANEQKAEGCLSQAWSNSTFIELVNSL